MSELQAQAIRPNNAPSMKANQIYVVGRIDHVSKYDGKTVTMVITPAEDAYSKPSFMRIQSDARIGDVGDDIKVLCSYIGWPSNYVNNNGEKVRDCKGFFEARE